MLAGLYLDLGYIKEAEQVLKEAKGFVKPDDKEKDHVKAVYNLHVLLAKVYQDRDSFPEAVTELEAAKASAPTEGPESVLILWNLGSTYANMKPPKSAEAIAMLKGFSARACKGAKAATYKTECEQAQTLVSEARGHAAVRADASPASELRRAAPDVIVDESFPGAPKGRR